MPTYCLSNGVILWIVRKAFLTSSHPNERMNTPTHAHMCLRARVHKRMHALPSRTEMSFGAALGSQRDSQEFANIALRFRVAVKGQ